MARCSVLRQPSPGAAWPRNGLLREEAGGAPNHFDEIWHLTKPVAGGSGWVVAGIQQVG